MAPDFTAARTLLQRAIAERAFPSAVVEAGTPTQPIWQEAFGRLSYGNDAPSASLDTIYDLASLTKVLATTPLAMRAVEGGAVALDEAVSAHIPQWTGGDRLSVKGLFDLPLAEVTASWRDRLPVALGSGTTQG